MNSLKYETHEYAELFPPIPEAEFALLKDDIEEKGLMQPITLYQGKVLDGRNRLKACQEAGVEARFIEYCGSDPLGFVISLNLKRRQLTASQRAAIAVECLPLFEAEAKKRQVRTAENRSLVSPKLDEQKTKPPSQTRATAQAAEQFGVSHGYIAEAKKIQQESPEAFDKLRSGEASISEAKKQEKSAALATKKAAILEKTRAEIVDNKPIIYHKSCLDLLGQIEPKSIGLLVTDPPYSTDIDDIEEFVDEWLFKALDKLSDTARAYICIGAYPKEISAYLNKLAQQDRFIVDCPLIWTYRNTLGITPKRKYNLNYQIVLHLYTDKSHDLDTSITNEMFSVQDINAPDGRQADRYHTWQKPDELANRLVRHSTRPGDTVLDPFACTGTFLIAASRLGLKTIGCDISPDNLKIAEARGCNVIY